jgi:asparagine synthase (glutamine-hydrolysing)
MCTPDGRYVLIYNGEIYNHPEIREDLVRRGHKFVSRTDTEVVLHAWAEWGPRAVTRFNGMFAFAMWDVRRRTITLVRDKYGIKPLYYAVIDGTLIFGSEQRVIAEHPGCSNVLDKFALVEYLTFQNIISDRTLNEQIRLLPAGSMLHASLGDASLSRERYWDFEFVEPTLKVDRRGSEEELREIIERAVRRQLRSDVEVGAYLSGGLDSGTVAAIAALENPRVKTFTCGFDTSESAPSEALFDERLAARRLAAHLGTDHHEIVVGPREMQQSLALVIRQLEEPRVGQSYPNYLIAEAASKSVKVVLSGAGGDELFGGYPWRYKPALEFSDRAEFLDSYYRYWNRLFTLSELEQVLAPIWSELGGFNPRDLFDDVIAAGVKNGIDPQNFLNQCLYFESKTFLHGLLVVEDKLSMAHGLETRLPLLDDEVVDFAIRCPSSFKMTLTSDSSSPLRRSGGTSDCVMGAAGDASGKRILRKVLKSILGEVQLDEHKQGFAAPDSMWLSGNNGESPTTEISVRFSPSEHRVDQVALREILGRARRDQRRSRLLYWSLISLGETLRYLR